MSRHTFWLVLLATSAGGCVQPGLPADDATDAHGTPLGEVRVISQLCIPDEAVRFEDVDVALDGVPQARTMREVLAANGYPEPPNAHVAEPLTEFQTGVERAVVKKWLPSKDGDTSGPPYLSLGEVLSRNGVFSQGGGAVPVWGGSISGQPIFEIEGHRPQDTLAITASRKENGQFITYWYMPQRQIKTGEFTEWQAPVLRETQEDESGAFWRQSAFQRLMRREKIPAQPVPQNAPKIRFRLSTEEQYYDQYRIWERDQKAIAKQFFSGASDVDRKRMHFAPRLRGTIPSC